MSPENLALKIREKAMGAGFDHCGIVKVDAVAEYALRLEQRVAAFPRSKPYYEFLAKLGTPNAAHEWGRSIIVCTMRYGKYRIPNQANNHIGKLYLYGGYKQPSYSREYAGIAAFDAFLAAEGIRFAKELFGIAPARLCAAKANLGIIRNNNFLYTEHGSWVWLETWLIDRELEYRERPKTLPSCPPGCSRCIDACPTGALKAPFLTDMGTCIARLTYSPSGEEAPEHLRESMGAWLYGCDDCQNACPMNRDRWEETEEYPQLEELSRHISLEKIAEMDEETVSRILSPMFWIIGKDKLWMWKCNVIRAMANSKDARYSGAIRKLCDDGNDNVRRTAEWACRQLGI
ncbi:MAG: 4Fe-4S ferredoxin [Nitrospirae bacterium GWC2_56_14]|nr:MAG: 4Fe-4S ferredoxin [Nitrospirae bacterium GWC2_56_14]